MDFCTVLSKKELRTSAKVKAQIKAPVKVSLDQTKIKSQRPINMAMQECNYCKAKGHRIHAMDAYGIYQTDDAGARILACPVLINKEKRLNPSAPTSETEFPALSALSSGTGATWTQQITMKLPISIQEAKQNAAKQVKQLSWADKQQFLQRQEELYRAEMEEDMREDEFYYAQREWDRKQEAEIDEREAKRAFMSRQAAYQDEDDELDELDDMIWSAMMEAESHRS